MTLALAIYAAFVGTLSLVLGLYTLVLAKVREAQISPPVYVPAHYSEEQAREVFREPRRGSSEGVDEETGMPLTYDAPEFEEVI